jgi:GntR family transcriptional regulator/MocR family aminotransferase
MLPYQTLISIDKKAPTPIYQQIANHLVTHIREGIIQPGASLPGSRELARLLEVHRKTIVAAYEELNAQDWIETIPRKGVRVSPQLPEIKPRTFKAATNIPAYAGNTGFHFNTKIPLPSSAPWFAKQNLVIDDGFPDVRLAPIDNLLREYRNIATGRLARRIMTSNDLAGTDSLRDVLVGYLSDTRGMNMQSDNIMITRGAQMAIYLAAGLLIQPGDNVLVGEPNYFMANAIFKQLGAQLITVPVDEQGINIEQVEAVLKKKKIKMLYIIPHHHHPTTVSLAPERRMRLLEIIRKYKLAVLEDDYDYSFHYSSAPVLPLASTNHEGCVVYIGSATKLLAPSIRIGFMVAPKPFIDQAAKWRRLIDIRGDNIMETALANLIRNGDIGRHIKKSNKIYHQRRDMLCDMLQEKLKAVVTFRKPAGGMAVWAQFNKRFPLSAIAAKAAGMGLFMNDGSYFNTPKINYNAIRFGFASLNESEMERIFEILLKTI